MTTILKRVFAICGIVISLGIFGSCSRDEEKILKPEQVAFFVPTTGNYTIAAADVVYRIPVGLTAPLESGKSRTVTVSSSSSTGAVEGTHYTYTKTLNFAPGKVLDTIIVTGKIDEYLSGREDVIIFSFTNATDASPSLNNSFTLNMKGPCFEGDIIFDEMLGNYTETYENNDYGPYVSSISNLVSTSATTANATISNFYDNDISAVATFDWTTVGGFTVTIPDQATPYAVGGLRLYIRSEPGNPGVFSYCDNTLTIPMELYTSGGPYDSWIMTMAR